MNSNKKMKNFLANLQERNMKIHKENSPRMKDEKYEK